MANIDGGKLIYDLDIDIGEFNRELTGIQSKAAKTARGMSSSFDRAAKKSAASVKTFSAAASSSLKSFAVGAAAALSLGAITAGAKNATAAFDELGKAARTSGLSSDFYQVLRVGAEEAGVAQQNLSSSLLAFTKRVGEAKAGTGPLASTLKKVSNELFEQLKASTSQEQALRIVADAMKSTTSATERAAIASAAFSRAGIDLVRILENGSEGLDKTAEKAAKLGLIVDEKLISSAEDMQNEYGLATKVIETNFRVALVNIMPLIIQVSEVIASASIGVRKLTEAFSGLDTTSVKGATEQIKRLEAQREQIIALAKEYDNASGSISRFFVGLRGGSETGGKQFTERLAAINAELEKARGALKNAETEQRKKNIADQQAAQVLKQKETAIKAETTALKESEVASKVEKQRKLEEAQAAKEAARARQDAARAVEKEQQTLNGFITSINESTSAIQLQTQTMGMSADAAAALKVQNDLLNLSNREGIKITDEYRGKVQQAVQAQQVAIRTNAAAKRGFDLQTRAIDETSSTFSGMIRTMIQGGQVDFKATINSMIADLAAYAAQLLIIKPLMESVFGGLGGLASGGGGGGLFGGGGGLFGGIIGGLFSLFGFAKGGRPPVGQPAIVGEKGPELFVPDRPGMIIPNTRTSSARGQLAGGGGTSQSSSINLNVMVDARGADIGVASKIESAMGRVKRDIEQSLPRLIKEQSERFPSRRVMA